MFENIDIKELSYGTQFDDLVEDYLEFSVDHAVDLTSVKVDVLSVKTSTVNIRDGTFDVYIGRRGRGHDGYFGNPFPISKNVTREMSLAKFEEYFLKRVESDPEYRKAVLSLAGKTLGCFCKPRACHGDIIAEWVNTHAPITPELRDYLSSDKSAASTAPVSKSCPQGSFLKTRTGTVVTPRRRTPDEMTNEEFIEYSIFVAKARDKFQVVVMEDDTSSSGWEESPTAWRKRMGIISLRDLAKLDPDFSLFRHTRANGRCGMCFVGWDHEVDGEFPEFIDNDDKNAHLPTKVPTPDVDGISPMAQRLFRWNNPEGYATWVEDLREEMGVHFDESLVLPEWKGPIGRLFKSQKPSDNPDDLDYIGDDVAEDEDGWSEPTIEFGQEPDLDSRGDFQ